MLLEDQIFCAVKKRRTVSLPELAAILGLSPHKLTPILSDMAPAGLVKLNGSYDDGLLISLGKSLSRPEAERQFLKNMRRVIRRHKSAGEQRLRQLAVVAFDTAAHVQEQDGQAFAFRVEMGMRGNVKLPILGGFVGCVA